MSGRSVFSVDAVCEILDANMSDEELARKYSVTARQIRVKRHHLINRNGVTTSDEFRKFISKHKMSAAQHNHKIDNKVVATNKEKDSEPLLKIMDEILDSFGRFEVACKNEKNKAKREDALKDEIAMLERLLDKNVVLLSRLVQRDLAFFTAVSELEPKDVQDDYLKRLGFSENDISFYRNHRLIFENEEVA